MPCDSYGRGSFTKSDDTTPDEIALPRSESDTDTDTDTDANANVDLGPPTYSYDGEHGNDKLRDSFNQIRRRFWKHHFSLSYFHGHDVLRLNSFLRVWQEMPKEYRPGLVFAATESADSQDPTAERSEAQVERMIADTWPKSLPVFLDFWRDMISQGQIKSMQLYPHLAMSAFDERRQVFGSPPWVELSRDIGTRYRRNKIDDYKFLDGLLCEITPKRLDRVNLVLGFDVMAFLSRTLQLDRGYGYCHETRPETAYYFFARHACAWNQHIRSYLSSIQADHGYIGMNFHLRSFTADLSNSTTTTNLLSGFQCKRESGTLSLCGTTLSFTERRYSLSVTARINPETEWVALQDRLAIYPHGIFIIIDVRDPQPPPPPGSGSKRSGSTPMYLARSIEQRDLPNIERSNCNAGIVEFQRKIGAIVDSWYEDWVSVLAQTNACLNLKLSDITNEESRRMLMYGHADMQESELYFALLQLLRLFSLSIDETVSYMEGLLKTWSLTLKYSAIKETRKRHDLPREFSRIACDLAPRMDPEELKPIQRNWENVRANFEGAADILRTQIRQKEEVIHSLRSGLFNSITVREAVRSTELNERSSQINERSSQINQRLLVFTVVTIIFLPPTFVSTFYGMDLFEELVDTPSKDRFWVVLVTVSLFTYTVAIAGMYGSEGWGALLARFDRARTWILSPKDEDKKAPPPDAGGSTSSEASKGKAPANADDAADPEKPENPAENAPELGNPPKTGSIWDRLPPMNLTRRRMRTRGNDEEAAKPGAGGEAAGTPGGKRTGSGSAK